MAEKFKHQKVGFFLDLVVAFIRILTSCFFDFNSKDSITLDEARKVMVETIECLQGLINSDRVLQPYLCEIPFQIKRITLGIGFVKNNFDLVLPPKIAFVTIIEGNIGYTIYDECKGKLKIIHRETYEEACEIVRQQQQGCS